MPDEIIETSAPKTSSTLPTPQNTAISQGIGLCAALVAASFFLPWINFLGLKPSGFDIAQKNGGSSLLLWAVPAFGIVATISSITKSSLKVAACLAGIVPLIVLGYGFSDTGADLLKLLDLGAYLGTIAAFATLILAARLK